MDTGTFTKVLNKREYTENEKIVLNYFFTNLDKNIYCAKNAMSNQLWAFLVGQYSRTELSMRDRFLALFDDAKKALEKWKLDPEDYVGLDDLAKSIQQQENLKLQYFEKKASAFLKKWWVDYGHSSLKDADRIRYAIEWISQVFTKVIESPFPALWDFQEKSTRYMDFWADSLVEIPEVKNSKYWKEITKMHMRLIDMYQDYLPKIKKILEKNWVIKKDDFKNEKAFERTLEAKAFDIVRYILPSNISTAMWASFSTRTLESHLSWMLSHPLEEVKTVAAAMHEEWLKLSPWLLKHVWESEYEVRRRNDLDWLIGWLNKSVKSKKYYKWIKDKDRVSIIYENDLDTHIITSIVFEASRVKWISYADALKKVKKMTQEEKEVILETTLWLRWKFDRIPRALQHSTILVEFLVDFWAYRDIQRHRATQQLWQGATAVLWYDYPEYVDLPWMEQFKKDYDSVMGDMTELARKVIEENCYLSEYVSALWHLIRTTFEMHPWQLAYVIELRTTPQWHHSYRRLFIELFNQVEKIAPIFSKYIRVWTNTESSRKEQEERASERRKKLWIE